MLSATKAAGCWCARNVDASSTSCPALLLPCLPQTLAEREAVLAAAEQTTRQEAEQLEERRRQTQELLAHAQLHEAQQARGAGWGEG